MYWGKIKKWTCALCLLCALSLGAGAAAAQDNPPAVLFEGMMETFFGDDNGLVVLGDYDVVFAPEGQVNAVVAIVDAEGTVLAQYPFYPDYGNRDGVFGRIKVQKPADVQLTEPGTYTMVFAMDGAAISRFPFVLKQTGAGDDPYNPVKTFAFDGHWRRLAHIRFGGSKENPIPKFTLWMGSLDMADPDTFQAFYLAVLLRDEEVVAHSKRQTSFYSGGHFERKEFSLYHPHEKSAEANARDFAMADLADGQYDLLIVRAEDRKPLRYFTFTVAQGEIQPLPQTQLGFEPASDFMVPRVRKRGSTGYEFEEVVWIGSK